MKRRANRSTLTVALLLGLSLSVLGLSLPAAATDDAAAGNGEAAKPAAAADAEFGGDCVMGLALGKDIKTDCSVSTVYNGRTFCFGNEVARDLFLKKPDEFLLQAHVYYSSRPPKQ
jgi:YHS domain-containing protein